MLLLSWFSKILILLLFDIYVQYYLHVLPHIGCQDIEIHLPQSDSSINMELNICTFFLFCQTRHQEPYQDQGMVGIIQFAVENVWRAVIYYN